MGAKRATSRFRSAIADQQLAAAAEIVAIEAAWSQRASEFPRPASERAIDSAAQNILIFGIPLALAWAHNRDDLARRASGIVREVAAGQAPPETLLPRILGTGPAGRETGGLIQQAARNADALVHTTVSEAATDARLPVWKANGVNAFRWHAVLDEKTTAGCALRHGLLYELDTLEPIRHSVPIEREPPRHYRCRSLLLPMAYADDIPMPEDGGQSTFREYFDSLTEAEQDRLFGQGRADLFRRGVITQGDLVAQNGRVLSLAELREIHVTPETQIALWWRRPYGDVSAGVMSEPVRNALGAADGPALLTAYFRKKQLSRHPELGAEDYARLPQFLRDYRVAVKQGADDALVIGEAGNVLVIVLRKDRAGRVLVRSMSRVRDAQLDRLRLLPIIDGDWDWRP